MLTLRRALPILAAALVIGGCGSDDSGPDTSDPGSTASVSSESPVSMLPPGAPLVVTAAIGPDSEQGKAALAFAEKVDPSDKDLGDELIKSIRDSDGGAKIDYETDLKPWLGETAALSASNFEEDFAGVVAIQSTDNAKAQAFLDKNAKDAKGSGTYDGVKYTIGKGDDGVAGLVGDFVVAASDEEQFKAAVDASKGDSMADDEGYKEALGRLSSGDNLGVVYADVDGFLDALVESGEVPASSLDAIKKNPAYQAGETAAFSVSATDDKMSFELATPSGNLENLDSGADLGELAGDAWLALAAPIDGKNIGDGFAEGVKAAGQGPEVEQLIEGFGIQDFLDGLTGITLRAGGTSLASINGSFSVRGEDEAATKKLYDTAISQAKAAGQGAVSIKVDGNTATANAGPYSVKLTADGGDLRLAFGDEPSNSLSDQDSYKSATGDLPDGARPLAFLDFGPLAELVKTIPDTDQMSVDVLETLGTFILGSQVDGDDGRVDAVLTLKEG